jgi:hypothetical protein
MSERHAETVVAEQDQGLSVLRIDAFLRWGQ